jgi:ELWxxDGT repeat protein
LWVTDGTSAGTSLVLDIDPGTTSSYPVDITPLGNGKALFRANDGTNGAELWVTDGTSAGTSLVQDINPGAGSAYPTNITALGNGEALFGATDGSHGTELWVTDGTSAGTSLVKDINPGPGASSLADITALGNGKAVFSANDGSDGTELWVTDGTSAGTFLVSDINPGAGNSNPADITAIGNGMALFKATDGTHGYELWETDGTSGGTFLVQGGAAGAIASNPSNLAVLTACFAAGTRIRALDGEIPVENLRVGDPIVTHHGVARAIRWIGYRHIDLKRHVDPQRVMPVRIRADALANGVPRRDLLVSSDHALFIDGMLIPARLLLNGGSLVAETATRHITYYHVELDSHDILLAEGVPAESYLDTGNRGMFENAGSPLRLHPDFADGQREALSCAPFVVEPGLVEPIWRRLAARAEVLGWVRPRPPELTGEPELHIVAGTRRLKPVVAENGHYLFVLPPAGDTLRLVSRAAQPSEVNPWVEDRRPLGVKIRRLTWRNGPKTRDVAMDDSILKHGWWAVEWEEDRPSRWTDGDAKLPALKAGLLEIELCGSMRYPVNRAAGCARRAAA